MAFDSNSEENGPIGSFAEISTGKSKYLPCFDKPQVCSVKQNLVKNIV